MTCPRCDAVTIIRDDEESCPRCGWADYTHVSVTQTVEEPREFRRVVPAGSKRAPLYLNTEFRRQVDLLADNRDIKPSVYMREVVENAISRILNGDVLDLENVALIPCDPEHQVNIYVSPESKETIKETSRELKMPQREFLRLCVLEAILNEEPVETPKTLEIPDLTNPSVEEVLSWSDLECRLALKQLRWPSGPKCSHCGGDGDEYPMKRNLVTPRNVREFYKCRNCRRKFALTAGTFFHRARLPMNKWFAAILMVRDGRTHRDLRRDLDVPSGTAATMHGKITDALHRRPYSRESFADILRGVLKSPHGYGRVLP